MALECLSCEQSSLQDQDFVLLLHDSKPSILVLAFLPLLVAYHLQVGVGTSELQAELITRSGFQGSFVNTDISAVAVQHMQQLHADRPQLSYQVADAK
jgi:hypothetical protein